MDKDIKFDMAGIGSFIKETDIMAYSAKAEECNKRLYDATGEGADFLGWLQLPFQISDDFINELNAVSQQLREKCEIVVVVGIGGSYLGAKAVIEALNDSFDFLNKERKNPVILYAGQNLGEDYLYELQNILSKHSFGIISISKSGTTTEPAIAFRILKTQLENQVGKAEAKHRIVCITDRHKGALRILANQEGYKTFVIEDNVGGRFSVLTPVGLLPIAVAGYDISALVSGARYMQQRCGAEVGFGENIALQYAAVRNELYKKGKKIEMLVNFHPKLHYVGEWWKQLYGESEGKDSKGIFPAAADFTTDLHSMGQYIQEGERIMFETVVSVQNQNHKVTIPQNEDNLDGLNFLAGKPVDHVNKMAELGTMLAHIDGGVPNLKLTLPRLDEFSLGQLIYFFEKACGVSGYLLEVNPFNQPGVEAYKKNMFALLDKPGYEADSVKIKERLSSL